MAQRADGLGAAGLMAVAVCQRRLEFRAGPESYVFRACAACRPALERGDVSCFFGVPSAPVEPVDPDEAWTCDLCREG